MMKKFLLLLALTSIVFAFPTIICFDDQSFAGGGCCMERSSKRSQNWRPNGLDFSTCRDLNQNRDDDDLYERRGYIYWEEYC
jgi:hypothetical protein